MIPDSFSGLAKFRRPSQLNIYTDGSKTDGRLGTGYVIYEETTEYDIESYSLPSHATVFQAELVAILLATCHILR